MLADSWQRPAFYHLCRVCGCKLHRWVPVVGASVYYCARSKEPRVHIVRDIERHVSSAIVDVHVFSMSMTVFVLPDMIDLAYVFLA